MELLGYQVAERKEVAVEKEIDRRELN